VTSTKSSGAYPPNFLCSFPVSEVYSAMLYAVMHTIELPSDDLITRSLKRREWCFELTQREVDYLTITNAKAIFGVPIRIISEEEDAKREI